MYRLIYTSVASTVMQPPKLIEILKYSRDWNKAHDITGCLAYIEGNLDNVHQCRFIQVLEGPEQEVLYLFQNIIKDSRHKGVTLIKQGQIEKRHFESWEMGFEKIALEGNTILQEFFRLDPQVLALHGTIYNNMMVDFMKSFYYYL
ncbi:BLUF domain-containing protein [Agrobacterium tumefaciens]|nr:BLUF domain-containing protein [Agrobacterium tumefaciens]NTE26865.1 BLUF domain-containing protein [Agrobacterium tumefaciens]